MNFPSTSPVGGSNHEFEVIVDEAIEPDIAAAVAWVERFVDWYNTKHLHSAINFVTPDDRHFGRHLKILSARSRVYAAARRLHPERWSGKTRNWEPIRVVCLNPEYDNASSKSKA